MTNKELKARYARVIKLLDVLKPPSLIPEWYTLSHVEVYDIRALIQATLDHIPDDDYQGDMPNDIWAINKVWCGNPSSKVSYKIHCLDADDSPRGVKYTRADTLANAIKERIG